MVYIAAYPVIRIALSWWAMPLSEDALLPFTLMPDCHLQKLLREASASWLISKSGWNKKVQLACNTTGDSLLSGVWPRKIFLVQFSANSERPSGSKSDARQYILPARAWWGEKDVTDNWHRVERIFATIEAKCGMCNGKRSVRKYVTNSPLTQTETAT